MEINRICKSSYTQLVTGSYSKGKAKQNILDISVNNETYPIHYLLKNRKNNFFIEKINE